MDLIIFIPGLIALWLVLKRKLDAAILDVYLPALFLCPLDFKYQIIGLPDPSFAEGSVLAAGLGVLLYRRHLWRWSMGDLLVGAYLLWSLVAEYSSSGLGELQNFAFTLLTCGLLPYVIGKLMIEPAGKRVAFARRFIWLLALIALISVWEFRMGVNLFRQFWSFLLPNHELGWNVQYRWGYGRIAGPFGHAILAGVVFSIGLLLQMWMDRFRHWVEANGFLSSLLKRGSLLAFVMLAGMMMTISRGPWIGASLAMAPVLVGLSRRPRQSLRLGIPLMFLCAIAVGVYLKDYSSVSRDEAATADQETAAYRRELMTQYYDLAMLRAETGWGHANVPQVPGAESIDNHYLFLVLEHGFPAAALFTLLLLLHPVRLSLRAIKIQLHDVQTGALLFTMTGVFIAIAFSLATVYLGEQLFPIVFLLMGWAEGCLTYARRPVQKTATVMVATRYQFERVLT